MNLLKRKKIFLINRTSNKTLSKDEVKVQPIVQKVPEELPVGLKELSVVKEETSKEEEVEIKLEQETSHDKVVELLKPKKNKKVVEEE